MFDHGVKFLRDYRFPAVAKYFRYRWGKDNWEIASFRFGKHFITETYIDLHVDLRGIKKTLEGDAKTGIIIMANERDIPYQSLIKMILAEHLIHMRRGK